METRPLIRKQGCHTNEVHNVRNTVFTCSEK